MDTDNSGMKAWAGDGSGEEGGQRGKIEGIYNSLNNKDKFKKKNKNEVLKGINSAWGGFSFGETYSWPGLLLQSKGWCPLIMGCLFSACKVPRGLVLCWVLITEWDGMFGGSSVPSLEGVAESGCGKWEPWSPSYSIHTRMSDLPLCSL